MRFMPNVAAEVRLGHVLLRGASGIDRRALERDLLDLFGLLGEVVPVEERLFDAATAISGCGPAFFALVVEALVDAGVKEGLSASPGRRARAGDDGGDRRASAQARRRHGVGQAGGRVPGRRHGRRAGRARGSRAARGARRSRARRWSSERPSCNRRGGDAAMSVLCRWHSSRADIARLRRMRSSSVYLILILVRILLSWIPRLPYNRVLHAVVSLRPRRHRSLPAALPARHPADRRRRLRARPEPDHRHHRAAHRAGDRGRPDQALAPARARSPGERESRLALGAGVGARGCRRGARSDHEADRRSPASSAGSPSRSSSGSSSRTSATRASRSACWPAATCRSCSHARRAGARCSPTSRSRAGALARGSPSGCSAAARSATWPTAADRTR